MRSKHSHRQSFAKSCKQLDTSASNPSDRTTCFPKIKRVTSPTKFPFIYIYHFFFFFFFANKLSTIKQNFSIANGSLEHGFSGESMSSFFSFCFLRLFLLLLFFSFSLVFFSVFLLEFASSSHECYDFSFAKTQ